jgi:AraC-like DNA-binding protein
MKKLDFCCFKTLFAFEVLLLLFTYCSHAQEFIIKIDKLPSNTPIQETIYLSGSFNQWNFADPNFAFNRDTLGQYSLLLKGFSVPFEYKITRGDWHAVECDSLGNKLSRHIDPKALKDTVMNIQIAGWRDFYGIPYTFIIDKAPENTPHDGSVYISGNFNEWNAGCERHKLQKMPNGTYQIRLNLVDNNVQYKFTRGNWASVEGRSNGRAIPNREFFRKDNLQEVTIKAQIESWEDLSGRLITPYTFTLLLAAFQGLLLIFAIMGLPQNNEKANKILSVLILLISVALIGRISTYDRDIFNKFPKLILLDEIIYFTYGFVFYFYIVELLTIRTKDSQKWLHFIPFILQILVYSPLLMENDKVFIDKIVDRTYHSMFMVMGGLAMIFNTFYWYKCFKLLLIYKKNYEATQSFEQNLHYFNAAIILKAACLIVWWGTYLIGGIGRLISLPLTPITEFTTDLIWIVFSSTTYFMGYFAMTQPEIFKIHQKVLDATEISQSNTSNPLPSAITTMISENASPEEIAEEVAASVESEEMPEECKALLDGVLPKFMDKNKPYTDPQLSLARLADLVGVKPHILSRAINEGYNKNFYDYVNGYRVEEFKKMLNLPQHQYKTFLAIALEVGFNSKTAFNRAFKKLTNITPREYFSDLKTKGLLSESRLQNNELA